MVKQNYQLTYKRSVNKDLRKLSSQDRAKIVNKILKLAVEPRPKTSSKLRGATNLYRLRYTKYRIIYQINDNKLIVLVIKVGHRKEIYRNI